jgi:hypothetical protein
MKWLGKEGGVNALVDGLMKRARWRGIGLCLREVVGIFNLFLKPMSVEGNSGDDEPKPPLQAIPRRSNGCLHHQDEGTGEKQIMWVEFAFLTL